MRHIQRSLRRERAYEPFMVNPKGRVRRHRAVDLQKVEIRKKRKKGEIAMKRRKKVIAVIAKAETKAKGGLSPYKKRRMKLKKAGVLDKFRGAKIWSHAATVAIGGTGKKARTKAHKGSKGRYRSIMAKSLKISAMPRKSASESLRVSVRNPRFRRYRNPFGSELMVVNPRHRALHRRRKTRNPIGLIAGLRPMELLPLVAVGGVSAAVTVVAPSLTARFLAPSPVQKYGTQIATIALGTFLVDKFADRSKALAWLVGGGSAVVGTLITEFIVPKLGLGAFPDPSYLEGVGAFPDPNYLEGMGDEHEEIEDQGMENEEDQGMENEEEEEPDYSQQTVMGY